MSETARVVVLVGGPMDGHRVPLPPNHADYDAAYDVARYDWHARRYDRGRYRSEERDRLRAMAGGTLYLRWQGWEPEEGNG